MSWNIDSEMLDALTSDSTTFLERPVDKISLNEQKGYLIKNIDLLPLEQKASIGNVLIMNGKKDLLQQNSEGTIINLDILEDDIVTYMYELLMHHLEKLQLK